jgi:hypothetical protein
MGSFRLPLMLLPQAVGGKAVNSPTVSLLGSRPSWRPISAIELLTLVSDNLAEDVPDPHGN